MVVARKSVFHRRGCPNEDLQEAMRHALESAQARDAAADVSCNDGNATREAIEDDQRDIAALAVAREDRRNLIQRCRIDDRRSPHPGLAQTPDSVLGLVGLAG